MPKLIIRRLFELIPVLFFVVSLTFLLMRLAPGGPFDSEKNIPEDILKNLNDLYHLNDPIYKQYLDYLLRVAQGDFGPSFKYSGRSVNELIRTGFPVSAELGIYALLFALVLGLSSGILGAIKKNTWLDNIPMGFSIIGVCVPSFLMGPLLVLIFAIYLGWLPVMGWDGLSHKVIPAFTLGAAYAAYIARLSRTGMIEVLSQDYVRTARAKGVSELRVLFYHSLRGGLTPVVSFLGPAAAGLLSGSFVVETIFQIPGLGRFYVQAAFNRDYTMIMGTTVFYAVLIVCFNLFSDLLLAWLNPKKG